MLLLFILVTNEKSQNLISKTSAIAKNLAKTLKLEIGKNGDQSHHYFTVCLRKTLIGFSVSRNGQHGSCVAWVSGSKEHGNYVKVYTGCQYEQEPTQVGNTGLPVTGDGPI